MQNGSDAQQLVLDKLKQATNILVTVEKDPSVDELAGALALTLLLNKLEKRGTAVFSGVVPPAIKFLEPDKTFEPTVDSLRDFIIALDKEKADRLRYKVEDDMVKIFITPYRTVLSPKDLQYSEGDFNVELIVALGVEKKDSLDKAIAAHGRILHDAAVVTLSTTGEPNELGAIDWQDPQASSICEMLATLAEALDPSVLDSQISTALLTGIVAATDRFSNEHTSAHVMNIAAELMATGANQQLIANNLQAKSGAGQDATAQITQDAQKPASDKKELSEASEKIVKPPKKSGRESKTNRAEENKEGLEGEGGGVVANEGQPSDQPDGGQASAAADAQGSLNIDHPEEGKTVGDALPPEAGAAEPESPVRPAPLSDSDGTPLGDEAAQAGSTPSGPAVPMEGSGQDLAAALNNAASDPIQSITPEPSNVTPALPANQPAAAGSVDSSLFPPAEPPTAEAAPVVPQAELPKIQPLNHGGGRAPWQELEPPTMGGTLNATAAEAAEEKAREAVREQQRAPTLMHRQPIGRPSSVPPAPMPPALPPAPTLPPSSSASLPPNSLGTLPPGQFAANVPSAPAFGAMPDTSQLPPLPPLPAAPAVSTEPLPSINSLPPLPSAPPPTGPVASWSAPDASQPALPPTQELPPAPTGPTASPGLQPLSAANAAPSQPVSGASVDVAADLEAARQAVSDALASAPLDPAGRPMADHTPQTMSDLPPVSNPTATGAAALPDIASLPAVQNLYAQPRPGQDVTQQFVGLEPPALPAPGMPPSGAPQTLPLATPPPPLPAPGQIAPANPADPTQFKIPGH